MKEKITTFQLGDKVAAEGHQANTIVSKRHQGVHGAHRPILWQTGASLLRSGWLGSRRLSLLELKVLPGQALSDSSGATLEAAKSPLLGIFESLQLNLVLLLWAEQLLMFVLSVPYP